MQPPSKHRWPEMQGGPEPHAQVPSLRQRSLNSASQIAQRRPSTPHELIELERQVDPSQHPKVQEVASHTQMPPLQR